LNIYQKSVEVIQVLLKSDKHRGYFTLRRLYICIILEWEMFQTKVVEKIATHIWCLKTFFRKSCQLWENVEKYSRSGQATMTI